MGRLCATSSVDEVWLLHTGCVHGVVAALQPGDFGTILSKICLWMLWTVARALTVGSGAFDWNKSLNASSSPVGFGPEGAFFIGLEIGLWSLELMSYRVRLELTSTE